MDTWKGTVGVKRSRVVKRRRMRAKWAPEHTFSETATSRSWDEAVSYELSINLAGLARKLAEKAAGSRSGRSTAMSGLVKLKVTKRVESNVELKDHAMSPNHELIEEIAC